MLDRRVKVQERLVAERSEKKHTFFKKKIQYRLEGAGWAWWIFGDAVFEVTSGAT